LFMVLAAFLCHLSHSYFDEELLLLQIRKMRNALAIQLLLEYRSSAFIASSSRALQDQVLSSSESTGEDSVAAFPKQECTARVPYAAQEQLRRTRRNGGPRRLFDAVTTKATCRVELARARSSKTRILLVSGVGLSSSSSLIQLCEEAPQLLDDQGMLPVHSSCGDGTSGFPQSIRIKDCKDRTLHVGPHFIEWVPAD
jgi:hypothetical protein